MPFENVQVILPDGQKHGPIPWATLVDWVRQQRVPQAALLIDTATQQQRPVSSFAELSGATAAPVAMSGNPYQSPQAVPGFPSAAGMPGAGSADEPVSYVVPYKNPPALIAYYLGVFSLAACIPFLGLIGVIMGFAAVVLGIKGLKLAAANPLAHGRVHAWIGILGGGLCGLVGLIINVGVIAAMIAGR
jgi:hypothetical protein